MNQTDVPFSMNTFLALLLAASATGVCVKWIKMPYAVALVLAGLAIGLSRVTPAVQMTPALILVIFLPALLFDASWNLDIKALKRDWLPISVLATVGVVVCMFGVAAILHYAAGLNVQTALLFGAMISATDPVSVIAIFRQTQIDERLTMIIEGESLFNDGTAVVLFQLVLLAVTSGGQWSLPLTAGSFFGIVFGGAALGALLGYIASCVTSAFDDHLLEITLTMVTAYGAFLIAEHLKVSSVMAVVAAGIVIGNYGSRTGMSATTRLAVNSFWEYAAFLVNSLLFLLIGLQVQWSLLVKYAHLIVFGVLAVFAARLVVVYGICPFVSTKLLPIPMKWRHLLFWGGLRGALVMAMALSLPLGYPDRDEIVNMTFGVVLFTLLVPGLTMDPLIKLLGMAPTQKNLTVFHERQAMLSAYKFELQALEHLQETGQISGATFQTIASDLNSRLATIDHNLEEMKKTAHSVEETEQLTTRVRLMKARKERLRDLAKEGLLDESALHKLIVSVDVELDMFENAAIPDDLPA